MDKEYYTITIPKGTLLFRSTNSVSDLAKDFAGLPQPGNSYCLFPNFNVFFYPYPFVSESVKKYDYTCVFVLKHDVKLINLIQPSPYTRKDRLEGKGGIVSCDKVDFKGCTTYGKVYDPCINFEKVKDKDIVGMIAIAHEDAKTLKKLLTDMSNNNNNNNNNNNKMTKRAHRDIYYNTYYKLYKDARHLIGVPEIILYPRREIIHENYTETIEEFSDWVIDNVDSFNYSLFHMVKGSDELQILMESLMSEEGFDLFDENYKVAINKETGFFQLLNFTDKSLPLDYDNNLSEKQNEFKFVSANLEELDAVNGIQLIKTIQEWVSKNDDSVPLILDELELTQVPELPPNVLILSLAGNKLKSLENLPSSLKVLDVGSNNIGNNNVLKIDNLPNTIESLKISNSNIKKLEHLPSSLTHLEAVNCDISYIKSFPKNMKVIILNQNYLEEIPKLPNGLQMLEIEMNPIISLGHIPKSVTVLKYDEPEEFNVNNI
jgi:hypothetical protein